MNKDYACPRDGCSYATNDKTALEVHLARRHETPRPPGEVLPDR